MRKIHTSILLYLCCSVMLVSPAFAAVGARFIAPKVATPVPSNSTGNTLNFGTYASFNDSYMQCVGSNGKFYWSAIFQTFANVVYTPCRTQMLSDIDFLGQHNIKTIRLWPVLSTFAYDDNTHSWGNLKSNINNLDQVLAELAK